MKKLSFIRRTLQDFIGPRDEGTLVLVSPRLSCVRMSPHFRISSQNRQSRPRKQVWAADNPRLKVPVESQILFELPGNASTRTASKKKRNVPTSRLRNPENIFDSRYLNPFRNIGTFRVSLIQRELILSWTSLVNLYLITAMVFSSPSLRTFQP